MPAVYGTLLGYHPVTVTTLEKNRFRVRCKIFKAAKMFGIAGGNAI
jgi:hypothetical protein